MTGNIKWRSRPPAVRSGSHCNIILCEQRKEAALSQRNDRRRGATRRSLLHAVSECRWHSQVNASIYTAQPRGQRDAWMAFRHRRHLALKALLESLVVGAFHARNPSRRPRFPASRVRRPLPFPAHGCVALSRERGSTAAPFQPTFDSAAARIMRSRRHGGVIPFV